MMQLSEFTKSLNFENISKKLIIQKNYTVSKKLIFLDEKNIRSIQNKIEFVIATMLKSAQFPNYQRYLIGNYFNLFYRIIIAQFNDLYQDCVTNLTSLFSIVSEKLGRAGSGKVGSGWVRLVLNDSVNPKFRFFKRFQSCLNVVEVTHV